MLSERLHQGVLGQSVQCEHGVQSVQCCICRSCYTGSIVYQAQSGEIGEPEKSGGGWDGINC